MQHIPVRGANPGGMEDIHPLQSFRTIPQISICSRPLNKNMLLFPKNRLTYTHVAQHATALISCALCFVVLSWC